ncbi:hypothetical protein AN964_14260 [Heyndrickxia shackletonii]|uniref:Uncharacterized protein n=1 Tax=Heyndrickxia shackletonii TaxID=157838 RepID=A0A0Q3TKL8_9BACI|nr:hypothetical protein AN964_14260 [Heyndrickxia shackletonii]
MNPMMRFRGEPVEVRMRDGRTFRGMMDGDPPPGGFFIRDGFRRRFFSFFAVAFVFSFRRGRRIF